jgi:hypothetical protein
MIYLLWVKREINSWAYPNPSARATGEPKPLVCHHQMSFLHKMHLVTDVVRSSIPADLPILEAFPLVLGE